MNAPLLDARDHFEMLADLRRAILGYTPEWSAGPLTRGSALMQVFAGYVENLIAGLNRMPDRGLLVFLDMMGTHLLPAQAARAPLIFSLTEGSPVDVTLPASTQVAAQPQPATPSALQPNPDWPGPVIFAT